MKYYYHKYRTSNGPVWKSGRLRKTRSGKTIMNYSKWKELFGGAKFEDFASALESMRSVGLKLNRQDAVIHSGKVLLLSKDLQHLNPKKINELINIK